MLDLKSLDLGRLKIHGANGQVLPVCICFYDGQNTLTLLSDGLIFSEPFYVSQTSFLNAVNGVALLILFAVSLSIGVADFKWSALFSLSDSQQVMFISRLPRTFAIVLTGASMAVAGMIMQILMRNRFVEPSMVGASQSAALGLLLMTLLLPAAPLLAKMSVAAVAALIGMLVFMLLIRRLPPTAQLMVPLGRDYFRRCD